MYVCMYVFYASKSDRLVLFLGVCAARVASSARAVVAIHARILRRNKRLKVSPRLGLRCFLSCGFTLLIFVIRSGFHPVGSARTGLSKSRCQRCELLVAFRRSEAAQRTQTHSHTEEAEQDYKGMYV